MHEIEEIYLAYAPRISKYLYGLTGDPFVAEELTQETFYQALLSVARFRGQSKLSTWLYSIARNVYLKHARRLRREARYPADLPAQPDDPTEEVDRMETREMLVKALGLLPEKQRTILILREVEVMSYAEIAQVLGSSQASIKVGLYRARAKLREAFARLEGGGNNDR